MKMSSNQGFGVFILGLGLSLGVSSLVTACGGHTQGPNVGSESHFLRLCDGECGGELSCIQGICTKACLVDETDSCGGLPGGARCTNQSVETGSVAVCDVACDGPSDCASMGDSYSCDEGYCRAPRLQPKATDFVFMERVQFSEEGSEALHCVQPTYLESNGSLPCRFYHQVFESDFDCSAPGYLAVSSGISTKIEEETIRRNICGNDMFPLPCEESTVCEVQQVTSADDVEICLRDEAPSSTLPVNGFCFLYESESAPNPLLSHCDDDEKAAFRFVGANEPRDNGYAWVLCEEPPSW